MDRRAREMISAIAIAIWMLTALAFCLGVKAAERTVEDAEISEEAEAVYCLVWGVAFYFIAAQLAAFLIVRYK